MHHSASNTEARSELLKLIAEAAIEEEEHRRKVLLIMSKPLDCRVVQQRCDTARAFTGGAFGG